LDVDLFLEAVDFEDDIFGLQGQITS